MAHEDRTGRFQVRRWLPAIALLLVGCSVSSKITDPCQYNIDAHSRCTTNSNPVECAEAYHPLIDKFCEDPTDDSSIVPRQTEGQSTSE